MLDRVGAGIGGTGPLRHVCELVCTDGC